MIIEQTQKLLSELKLYGISESLSQRIAQSKNSELGYEAFLNLALEDEKRHRDNVKIARLMRRASFKQKASLEGFEASPARGLSKSEVADLSTLRFLDEGQNIIISGPTGVGKSFLAQAIGVHACRHGRQSSFYRMNGLIEKFSLERAKANYLNFLKRCVTPDLLILDDFGIKPLEPSHYQDLYDVIDERGDEKSLVITTQLPPQNWGEVIDDPVTCEAITDRILARAQIVKMKGESFRKRPKKRKD